jgi:hypothetical protein
MPLRQKRDVSKKSDTEYNTTLDGNTHFAAPNKINK